MMMEMIASYGNPISPQPPPLARSYEDPGSADLRGPSFQDYLKNSVETVSSPPPQEGNNLEHPSRDTGSAALADQADQDQPASPRDEGGMKESGKSDKREDRQGRTSETREALTGKSEKQGSKGGSKTGPEASEDLLKKRNLQDKTETEKIPGGLKEPSKEDIPVSEEELFPQIAASLVSNEEGEAGSEGLFLASLMSPGSGDEAAAHGKAAPRDSMKERESGEGKVKPSGEGAVKTAGSSSSGASRLKIFSAENPENGIEVSLTDARSRGKTESAGSADIKRSGSETLKNNEALLNRPESLQAGEGENGNVRVMELGGDSQERSGTPSAFSTKESKSAAASFGEILREKGISQVVRQTGILLKDDNRGEIKLILKPESLGKVRIQLNLEDNRIAGRILVENSSVRDTFNQNMEELQRALRESGFESAHLEVSVEGETSGHNQEGRRDPLRNQRMIARAIEEGLPGMITLQREDSLVNLMA